jgi:hypothetical protein
VNRPSSSPLLPVGPFPVGRRPSRRRRSPLDARLPLFQQQTTSNRPFISSAVPFPPCRAVISVPASSQICAACLLRLDISISTRTSAPHPSWRYRPLPAAADDSRRDNYAAIGRRRRTRSTTADEPISSCPSTPTTIYPSIPSGWSSTGSLSRPHPWLSPVPNTRWTMPAA